MSSALSNISANYFNNGLGSSIVGGLGALGSFGLNFLASNINSSRAWKYAQKAMALQDQYNRAFTRDQYGLQRQGLEKAGYNPLLAISSGSNNAIYSGQGINSDSDSGAQALQSAIMAQQQRNENKLAKSQNAVNESQVDLNAQLTYKALADEIYARANSAVATATEQKIFNDIYWDNEKNRELIKQIQAETKFTNERARGFSATSSDSWNGNIGGKFGKSGKGKGIFGFDAGADAGFGHTHLESHTY